jgi:hypothetical protein
VTPYAAMPPRVLLALTVVVLAAHGCLLQFAPASIGFDEPLQTRRFVTRSVEARPVASATPGMSGPIRAAPAAAVKRPPPLQREPSSSQQVVEPPAAPPQATVAAAPELAASAAHAEQAPTPAPTQTSASVDKPPALATAIASAETAGGDPSQRPGALHLPAPIRLKYRIGGEYRGLPQGGLAELLWQHDGKGYEARLTLGNLFRTRVQTSRGSLGSSGLMPARFSDKSGSERAAHFERAADGQGGHVVFSANSPVAALAPGAQDRLSLFLQLASMVAGEPGRYLPGESISMQVVGARDADVWLFRIEGQEPLDLSSGPMLGLKLVRSPRREYDQKVELWLGASVGYLPVRIRITEPNGNFLDQQLSSMETP